MSNEVLAEQTSTLDFCWQFCSVSTLTRLAPVFDLLMFLWLCARWCEFAVALRTGFKFEFDGLVDLILLEGCSEVLLVSFLTSDFFLTSPVLLPGRFDDVGRRRFGGVGGVFLKFRNEGFEFGDSILKFGNASVLGIHRRNSTNFRPLTKEQF